MNDMAQRLMLCLLVIAAQFSFAAKPIFLITPIQKAPTTIYAGQTLTAIYEVKNNTPYILRGNGLSQIPPGVTQGANTCGSTFDLAPGASCQLTLKITERDMRGAVAGGPVVCNTKTNPVYCSQPSAINSLNVSPDKKIQAIINNYLLSPGAREGVSGIAVSIFIPNSLKSLNGDIVSYFTGRTLRSGGTPVTKNNLFQIGSITKSFVSAIILQLESEGVLSINDTVGTWLPGQYPNWSNVTIKELLNMTSGIPNYTENEAFFDLYSANPFYIWTDTELLSYASPNLPIPPVRPNLFGYSNSNTVLSALIIEAATNDTFAHQLQTRIIEPYHLNNLFYGAGPNGPAAQSSTLPRMVHGYVFDEDTNTWNDITYDSLSWAGAAGAIITDTATVVRWVQLLHNGLLFTPAYRAQALAELTSLVSLRTGLPITTVTPSDPAGFALNVYYFYFAQLTNRLWSYEGSTLGYRVMYAWSSCSNLTIVTALNSKGGADGNADLGDAIADLNADIYRAIVSTYPQYNCKNA